eukprot:TRINITY_DN1968_c0_g1_i7.p1 TRINITY_DN1968_c0_g1~~TRINITY_DN1968_c0_g1_i7.p1  ORF type:complete len:167 (-),score=46.39 TRINITY_DN1968_c0_g1_i7:45-497(-)
MCIRDRQREVLQIMRDIEFSNGFFDIYEMLRIEDPNGGTPQPRPDTASTSNSRTSREMTPLNRSIENKRPSHMNLGSQGTLLYIIDDETDFSLYDLSKWRLLTTFNLAITSKERYWHCLLYTSDAADDLLCVDLGGRRIIKKKKQKIEDI